MLIKKCNQSFNPSTSPVCKNRLITYHTHQLLKLQFSQERNKDNNNQLQDAKVITWGQVHELSFIQHFLRESSCLQHSWKKFTVNIYILYSYTESLPFAYALSGFITYLSIHPSLYLSTSPHYCDACSNHFQDVHMLVDFTLVKSITNVWIMMLKILHLLVSLSCTS
jgi:hypothetical protein